MGYTTNPATGVVQYSPDMMQLANVLQTDLTANTSALTLNTSTAVSTPANTTGGIVPDFTIPLGRNERLILNYHLYLTSTTAAGFKFRIDSIDPVAFAASTPVRTAVTPALWRQFVERTDDQATALTTATGSAIAEVAYSLTASAVTGYASARILVTGNATTNSILVLNFSQNASTAVNTILRAGSYVEYRKF
jgi:hypothetical protein